MALAQIGIKESAQLSSLLLSLILPHQLQNFSYLLLSNSWGDAGIHDAIELQHPVLLKANIFNYILTIFFPLERDTLISSQHSLLAFHFREYCQYLFQFQQFHSFYCIFLINYSYSNFIKHQKTTQLHFINSLSKSSFFHASLISH